ncbi:MAG TPA: hypothetical protein VFF73_03990 [Planctomycetota bacterium]|nr:hypothetical protein [Planctomycetota bacterium]
MSWKKKLEKRIVLFEKRLVEFFGAQTAHRRSKAVTAIEGRPSGARS